MRNENQYVSPNTTNLNPTHLSNNSQSSQIDIGIPDLFFFPTPSPGVKDNQSAQLDNCDEIDIGVLDCIQNLKEEDFMVDVDSHSLQQQEQRKENQANQPLVDSLNNYYEVFSVSEIETKQKLKTRKIQVTLQNKDENQVIRRSDIITIKLEGLWSDTIIEGNDKVYISISNTNYHQTEKCYYLNDSYNSQASSSPLPLHGSFTNIKTLKNFIIIYPELLLSPSLIKSAFPCNRKAFFNEEFRFILGNESNKNLLTGTIIHILFENMFLKLSTLNTQSLLTSFLLEEELKLTMKDYYLDIALLDLSYSELYSECRAYISQIISFFTDFYFSKYAIAGLTINKYIASEQLYQSQVLGMKGVIDILIQTTNENDIEEVIPFELKTGYYQSNSDVMQVLIYCLILSEQLGSSSSNGLLYYLKKDNPFRVKVTMNDIINVIVVRNNIAKCLHKYENTFDIQAVDLPSLYRNSNECESCYKRLMCKSHYDLYEKHNTLDEFVANQPNKVQEYFKYFYNIINNEQAVSNQQMTMKYLKMNKNSDLSEFTKYAIGKVTDNIHSLNIEIYNDIDMDIDIDIDIDGNLSQIKEKESSQQKKAISSQYNEMKGSYLIYDPESKKIFKGLLINKDSSGRLVINILKYQLDEKLSEYFATLKREQNKGIPLNAYLYMKNFDPISTFTFKLMRGNLLSFCSTESNSSIDHLRRIIIYSDSPTYTSDVNFKDGLIKYIKDKFYDKYVQLNQNQKSALIKSLICNDYTLIIGFPGSGKTTVIALLVEILSSMNKKILVTAHTNIAVDNILLKLKQGNIGTEFCRIGSNMDVIHKDICDYVVSPNSNKFDSVLKWKEFLNKQNVYATTTLGITNKLFSKIKFDYCIVDEACQDFEPNLLGPLMLSKKFILVGDPFQLRALLKSSNPSTPTSLFERLLSAHESMAVQLEFQYRMNESILRLSNECVYENVMKCANDDIAKRTIGINMNRFISQGGSPSWVKDIIDPQRSVVLVDYSSYEDDAHYFNKVIDSNEIEVNIINELMKGLSYCKFNLNEIGILTPYKAQEGLLKTTLLKRFQFDNILTIDKSQGIEKEIIIISCVKTNTKTKLLKDIARINVAFTRPKAKLIIIGLRDVLIEIDKLSAYVNLLIKLKWIYEIDKSAYASMTLH